MAIMISASAQAAHVTSQIGNIEEIYMHNEFGAIAGKEGGDVLVKFKTNVGRCESGVWLSPAMPGYNTSVLFLLTAFTENRKVSFDVYDHLPWPGSSSESYCKFNTIKFH